MWRVANEISAHYVLRQRNRIEFKREHCRVNYDRPFTCYKCDSTQYSMSDYYKRLGRHFCSKCGKEYKWMQSLVRHEREECGKDPQYSCYICGAKIRHKWMLKKHVINVHRLVISNGKNIWNDQQ
ncbi:zinc finger protein 394-like [Mycetomoellerius zeteki]|uniref:zinc finger protein 394-like n=1 Tax=Mycetomoellerius zeteki TaxID=64791 RepID=UPI00084EBC46|nr:PREDICTED: zinc finger protein 394-like [Trachymyrmex zeteki]